MTGPISQMVRSKVPLKPNPEEDYLWLPAMVYVAVLDGPVSFDVISGTFAEYDEQKLRDILDALHSVTLIRWDKEKNVISLAFR